MNSQVTQLMIVLGGMQASRMMDWANPSTLFTVRAAYVASNVVIMLVYLYVYIQIQRKNDLTTLKYVEAPAPFSGESADSSPLVTTTVKDYDTQQLISGIKSSGMGLVMMAVMHLYMKFSQPLLVQSIMPLKTLLESKVARIHLFGAQPAGDLKRPWKATGLFAAAQGDVKTDKASIKKAEKETKVGVKEE